MAEARVIQAIETSDVRGNGTMEDPFRRVMQYWTLSGELLAEVDPETKATKNDWRCSCAKMHVGACPDPHAVAYSGV